MQLARPLRLAAAVAAAAVSVTALGAAPALAAPKPKATVVLSAKPANPSPLRTATFEWTGVAGATFTCSLDGAAAVACASPTTYSGLSDGAHSFSVRSKAPGYRPGGTSYGWRVAATPPGAPAIAPVASPTKENSASISFTNADPTAASHVCSLDGAAPSPCISPLGVPGPLAEGSHTVVVTARDVYGFTGGSSSVSWVVDVTAPGSVVITAPTSPTNETSFSIPFTETDAVSFTCSLDGATPSGCTSPYVVPGPLPEGPHSLTVTGTDGAGNVGNPGTAVWVVDVTAPAQPTIVTGPADRTNQTSAEFQLGDIDSSGSLQCRLDGDAWAPCTSPVAYSGLTTGSHTFQTLANDAAGNTSDIVTRTWEIDLAAPAPPVFTEGPISPSNSTTPTFDFVETDPDSATFQCALDGAAYVACTGPEQPTVTGDGLHVFAVRAQDSAGNWSAPVTHTWTLDTTAPTAPVFSTTPAASTTDTTAVFSFASEPGATFTCAVDGAAAVPCASPLTLTGLAEGAHTVVVVARDAAGNTSQTAYGWTVTAAPTPDPTPTPTPDPTPTPTPDPGTGPTDPGTGTTTPTTSTEPAPPAPTATASAATTTTVTTSSALRGVSTAAFSGAVRGVPAAAVQLRVAGSSSSLAVGLSCADAAGTTVDCAASGVRRVSVQPTVALVPGQSYTLAVAGVTDVAGTAVAAVSAGFRASTSEQESSLRAGYLWQKAKTGSAYGRSYVTEQRAGAAVAVSFTGTKVTWYTMTGPTQGVATVYVDGVKKARVNNYAAANHWRVARTIKGLKAGKHQLRIVVAGVKGAKAGKGTSVVLDAVRAGKTLTTSPKAVATWRTAKATTAAGSAYAVANLRGATTSFTFRGTSVSWFTQTAPTMGKAKVYVDGELKGTVDNFSKRSKWNVRRTVSGLSDAQHTVRVVVTGSKRKAAKGTDVVLDRWLVG